MTVSSLVNYLLHVFNPSGEFDGYSSCDTLAVNSIHRLTPPPLSPPSPPPPTVRPLTSLSCCHTPFVSSFVLSNSRSVKSSSRVRAMILEDGLQGRIDSTFYEVLMTELAVRWPIIRISCL
jgi:hypothetical protein